jgi:hypothetical protein
VSSDGGGLAPRALEEAELEALRAELESRLTTVSSLAANPDDVQRSVARVVLSLVEFLRQLMERQAVRRMEAETLDGEEIEKLGVGLMQLEETVREIAARFGLTPDELNLDLGPLGKLR